MRKLFDALYKEEDVEIEFDVPVEEAVNRLHKKVGRTFLSAIASQRMVGFVSREKIYIQRVVPLLGNSFKPIFIGTLSCENGKTILSGVFRLTRYTQIFMSFWFGFIAFWTVLASFAAVMKPSEVWFFPLAGILMLGGGFGMLNLAKWLSRNDKEWLKSNMSDAIRTNS